jgi:PAS domain S-box-containing protein
MLCAFPRKQFYFTQAADRVELFLLVNHLYLVNQEASQIINSHSPSPEVCGMDGFMIETSPLILIVEDAPEDRAVYKRHLSRAGNLRCEIQEAASAESAVEICRHQMPDCLLLDLHLPDLNGLDVLNAIAREAGPLACGIIFLAGAGDTELVVEAMKQGPYDYLKKSWITGELLRRAVANAIEKAEMRRELIAYRREIAEKNLAIERQTAESERGMAERQQIEENLHEREQMIQSLINTVPTGIYIFDIIENRTVFANPEMVSFLGYKPEEIETKGLSVLDGLMHPEDQLRLAGHFAGLAEAPDGTVREFEYRMRHRRGKWCWFISRDLVFKRSHDGRLQQILGTAEDITERKQIEEERERLLECERTARETAEAASRTKDEFLAAVSHELRSPLNAILGWVRVLMKGNLKPEAQTHALEVIEGSAQAQQVLIEDLLDTARIISGKMKLETRPVNLIGVIEAAASVVRPAVEAKGIELNLRLDCNNQVTGDSDRLQQVIWNLLANAVKFTPQGGRIEVSLQREGPYVQAIVSDNGQGIKPDILPYVFDRFRQGNDSDARRFGGLGLGLALVRHLIELHGGNVSAESSGEGQGATFTINLPVRAIRGDVVNGRAGEWESGRVGEWESGRVGEWESGRGGEWESGRVGEWESGRVGEWGSERVGEWESGRKSINISQSPAPSLSHSPTPPLSHSPTLRPPGAGCR